MSLNQKIIKKNTQTSMCFWFFHVVQKQDEHWLHADGESVLAVLIGLQQLKRPKKVWIYLRPKSVAPTQDYIKSKIQITVYFFPFVVVVVLEMISALFFPFLIHNNYKNTIFYLTVVFFIYVSPHKYYQKYTFG